MAQCETVDRILNAASILFAERGFAETSLRTITGMANVNLAAVNYHFGTKKALIQGVFSRFLQPFCDALEAGLDTLEAEHEALSQVSAAQLLQLLFAALTEAMTKLGEQPERFMRLLAVAYTQVQAHLHRHLSENFGSTYDRYTERLKTAMPHLGPIAFYWRLNFMLGASIFTLSSFESIQGILLAEHQVDMNMQDAVGLLIPALAGMLEAANTQV